MWTTSAPELSSLAQVLASDARAAMVLAMLDGRAWTLGELASLADVSRSTASEHADRLVAAGLVEEVHQGRHRYLRIGDARVAETVEGFAALSERVRPAAATLRAQRTDRALRAARSCYRHLAGGLGVALRVGLQREGMVSPGWELTGRGRAWLGDLGVELPRAVGRPLVRPCLDWTERREHLAGLVADELFATFCSRGWIRRIAGTRAVELTDSGRDELAWVTEPERPEDARSAG